jgi:hypothetical protein
MINKFFTITIAAIFCFLIQFDIQAQEQYGKTLNVGLGIGGHSGYTRYANRVLPVFTVNYEIDVVTHFTVAPFASVYSYSNNYNWNNRGYYYRETVIPVGVKGTFYFDEFLGADNKWDFYAASSAGFAIVSSRWEDGYDGDRNYYNDRIPVFIDFHLGAEYHLSSKLGIYLDLSSGISTFGISFHN